MIDLIGIMGASLFILSYFLLQRDKAFARTVTYSAMNLLAACIMLVSVYYDWNSGALVNNLFWMVLSLYGVYSAYKERNPAAMDPIEPTAAEVSAAE